MHYCAHYDDYVRGTIDSVRNFLLSVCARVCVCVCVQGHFQCPHNSKRL